MGTLLEGYVSVSDAAGRLGMSRRGVELACEKYKRRLEGGDPDRSQHAGELACRWFQRGAYLGYLVSEQGIAQRLSTTYTGPGRPPGAKNKPKEPPSATSEGG